MSKPLARISNVFKKISNRTEKDVPYLWPGIDLGLSTVEDDETSSVDSFSTTATADDLPGPGRIIDKHVYQFLGRKLERFLSRNHSSSLGASLSSHSQYIDFDCSDGNSINSISTNATDDDNPGTGRIIDKHIYQRFGRKIENIAFQVTFSTLSPAHILHYFVQKDGSGFNGAGCLPDISIDSPMILGLGEVVEDVNSRLASWHRPCVAGLKSLVKQSKSSSLYRSSAALAALIHVSMSKNGLGNFYIAVARVDSLFHLEVLADQLDESDPERIYFTCLLSLARANLYVGEGSTLQTTFLATNLRQDLLNIYDTCCTFERGGFALASKAYLPFAKATSCIQRNLRFRDFIPASRSVIETAYFLTIFILRNILELYCQAVHLKASTQRLVNILMTTFARWLDVVMTATFSAFARLETQDLQFVQLAVTLQSPFHAIRDTQFASLFPNVYNCIQEHPILSSSICTKRSNANPALMLRSYIRASTLRSCRLLYSPTELEREVKDSALQCENGYNQSTSNETVPVLVDIEGARHSFRRALSAPAHKTSLAHEFREARGDFDDNGEMSQMLTWAKYKDRCRMRRAWGEYSRSNLDWDWDPSKSLNLLFEIKQER